MSYGLDLVHVPAGASREEVDRLAAEQQQSGAEEIGPIDSAKEQSKQALASALISTYPSLKPFVRNFKELAEELSISESEARRLHRDIELNDEAHSMQITLFDDAAGISFSPSDIAGDCRAQVRHLWDCLKTLEAHGYAAFDPQIGRVLALDNDFEAVHHQTCPSAPSASV